MISYLFLTIDNESDRAFMEALFERYARLICYKIRCFVQDSWMVEDIMQTTLEKLIDKIPTLRSYDEKHRANYICSTARNTAINYLRRRGIEVVNLDCVDLADPEEPESLVLQGEEKALLQETMGQLSQKDRSLLDKRYFLDMSAQEIAVEQGRRPGSVRMALTRARRELRRLYIKRGETNK